MCVSRNGDQAVELPIMRNNALVPRPGSSATRLPCRRNLGVGRPSIYTTASGAANHGVACRRRVNDHSSQAFLVQCHCDVGGDFNCGIALEVAERSQKHINLSEQERVPWRIWEAIEEA